MEAIQEIDLELCYPSGKARAVDAQAVLALAESINEQGLLSPITVRRCQRSRSGQMSPAFEVIAGLHRVKAFRRLGRDKIPAIIVEADDLHAELLMIDENLLRNNLSPAERASAQSRKKAIWQILHPETKAGTSQAAGMNKARERGGQVGHDVKEGAPRYDEVASAATGQSERAIRREVQRGEALGEDVLAKVARTSLDNGEELDALAKLSPDSRDEMVARAAAGENISVKTAAKQAMRDEREKKLGQRILDLPDKRYGVILADPEWEFVTFSAITGLDRSAANHYPTSPWETIGARDVQKITAKDCLCLMWVTDLKRGITVLESWGFEYKSYFVWVKDIVEGDPVHDLPGRYHVVGPAGLGFWNRDRDEICLIGTRGEVPCLAPGTQTESVWFAARPKIEGTQRSKHSAKPENAHLWIEKYYPNTPKIELNARKSRAGWDTWGIEAPEEVEPDGNCGGGNITDEIQAGSPVGDYCQAEDVARESSPAPPDDLTGEGLAMEEGRSSAPAVVASAAGSLEDHESRMQHEAKALFEKRPRWHGNIDERSTASAETATEDETKAFDIGREIPAFLRRMLPDDRGEA